MRATSAIVALCPVILKPSSGLLWERQLTRITLQGIGKFRSLPTSHRSAKVNLSEKKGDGSDSASVGMISNATLVPEESQKVKPQDLFRIYGPAYLVTSIVLAIISYAVCYLLISTGVDVVALLEKVGIKSSVAAANTGTAAIAYAIHKAASPIRFPPTVALTPIVARWFGRKLSTEQKK